MRLSENKIEELATTIQKVLDEGKTKGMLVPVSLFIVKLTKNKGNQREQELIRKHSPTGKNKYIYMKNVSRSYLYEDLIKLTLETITKRLAGKSIEYYDDTDERIPKVWHLQIPVKDHYYQIIYSPFIFFTDPNDMDAIKQSLGCI